MRRKRMKCWKPGGSKWSFRTAPHPPSALRRTCRRSPRRRRIRAISGENPCSRPRATPSMSWIQAERVWNERSASPTVQGKPSWIGDAWFGRKAWVIKTYADHLFSFNEYNQNLFHDARPGQDLASVPGSAGRRNRFAGHGRVGRSLTVAGGAGWEDGDPAVSAGLTEHAAPLPLACALEALNAVFTVQPAGPARKRSSLKRQAPGRAHAPESFR